MKQIIAILPPHRLEKLEEALHHLPHLPGFTLFKAKGHSRGHGGRINLSRPARTQGRPNLGWPSTDRI